MAQESYRTVRTGPGWIYIGAVGAAEPGDITTAIDTNVWDGPVWTDEGIAWTISQARDAVEVAEVLEPVRYDKGLREITVSFSLASFTALNMKRAMNGGTITTGVGYDSYVLPDPMDPDERLALLFESWPDEDGEVERVVFRKCVQTGDIETARRRSPDKALIPVEFKVESIAGQDPVEFWFPQYS